ncbi:hypothetical protein PG997_012393 [Apiospora hydei]|uniref:Uncharacterized protein n=1 Tax=Apiospora hydei TaxID=1337664 RepID=A0ABR1V5T0_9PEZI
MEWRSSGHAAAYGPPQMMTHSPLSGPPVDYFSNNARPVDTLAARFSRQGEPRPRSSLGFHGGPPSAYDDYEPSQIIETPPPMRHASLARRPKKSQDDRTRMPPPARPQTTKPERLVFRPPPPANHRKSAHFADDDELDDDAETEDGFYQPAPGRQDSFEYGNAVVPSRPRRTSIDSEDYEDSVFPLDEPTGHNRRHSSYNFEDKVKQAASYQNEVSGGTAPLTAETLRRVKDGGTSRSSRSTQSRDESSYKQSATTRTTRSSSGDDDITIKVPDGAIVEVGNAKISCRMGGEINIGRNNSGSDRGTVYEDDRKSRAIEDRKSRAIEDRNSRAIEDRNSRAIEDRKSRAIEDRKSRAIEDRKSRTDKPATRNRASSQSGSYSHAPYLGGHGGYAPAFGSHYGSPGHYAPPQYPQYPSSEYEYYET